MLHGKKLLNAIRRKPLKSAALFAGLIILAGVPWFFLPKNIEFIYAGDVCAKELTLFPGVHKQIGDGVFDVDFTDRASIAGIDIAATSVCFTPTAPVREGTVAITTSPGGSWLLSQQYVLSIGPSPRVNASALTRPVPTTKPLVVLLDKPDRLHRYELAVDKKSTYCTDSDTGLKCEIQQLGLEQGKKYRYEIVRHFNNTKLGAVGEGTLETLKAVTVVKSDVSKNQVINSKPKTFSVTLDKPVAFASAQLKQGKAEEEVDVTFDDKVVTVAVKDELAREKQYTLVFDHIEAKDGSTLVEPYTVDFTMSGGPKVAGISIGPSRVELGAQAVITFDQELSTKQDIASLVSVSGLKASARKLNARQVAVQLDESKRCAPFTITLAGGALSKYDIKSASGWKHQSRTICYTTSVYGTSIQGRPLIAYHFGNQGPVTLYTGAIHGNEISSKYMMDSWIAELEANPSKIGKRRVVVIPSINPDGVAAGTRNNSRNVNLSRNFPTSNWVKDIDDTNGRVKGGGGSKPLSEPESAALARFTQALAPRLLVSYHAIGSLAVGDPGGYSAGKAAQYARMVGYRNATGAGGTFDYAITGAYEDWTYRNVGIPSMIVELGSYTYHDFGHHRAALWAMLDN